MSRALRVEVIGEAEAHHLALAGVPGLAPACGRTPDIVAVASAVPDHDEVVRAAIGEGRHVFCEWPLTTGTRPAMELRALAQHAGVHHVVGLRGRADPGVRHARDLLAQGEIGEVLAVTLSSAPCRVTEPGPGEALLLHDGGQALDVLRFCLGEPAEIGAALIRRCPRTVEADQVLVMGTLESGVAVSAHLQLGSPGGTGFRMEVQGRRGALTVTAPCRIGEDETALTLSRDGGPPVPVEVPERLRAGAGSVPAGPAQGIARLYGELVRAIREDVPQDPDFTTAAGLHCLLDTITESAAAKRCRSL
ncbi:putative dehydrogenase [Crossiella equi]|uniref:Dehydrogenase n=1 Tax=Crossiella equi TaxID=130796 RepID=A0ABS5ABC2_9PSEU|nr:Gfo/Idh/MocA family oxidoreductase [Crossiella equi]MBP2473631.1 putative dehydrogenase [Crossiella equi]